MGLELDFTTFVLVCVAMSSGALSVMFALGLCLDREWIAGREWGRVVSLAAFIAQSAVLLASEAHPLVVSAVVFAFTAMSLPRANLKLLVSSTIAAVLSCVNLTGWLVVRSQEGFRDPSAVLVAFSLTLGLLSVLVMGLGTSRHFSPLTRATILMAGRRDVVFMISNLMLACLWLSVKPGARTILLSLGLALSVITIVRASGLKSGQRLLSVTAGVVLVAAVSYAPVQISDESIAPVQTGSVAASPYGVDFDKCASITTDYLGQKDCYSEYFIQKTDSIGVDGTLDLLVKIHQDNVNGRSFLNHCHEVLHDIAKSAAQKYGVEKLFGSWVVTCTGGFAHGVLSEYVHGQSWEKVRREFPTFCDNMTKKVVSAIVAKGKPEPTDTGWIDWNCNHMIGHIAYENNRDNVPETAKLCLSWPVGDTQWRNCGAGMFMEYYLDMTRNLNGVSLPKDANEIHSLCRKLDPDIQEPCYNESGAAVWQYNSGTAAGAFGLCKQLVPAGEMLDACYSGVSRMVTVANGFVPSKMNAACISGSEVDPKARDLCGNEVAGSLVMETDAPDEAMNTCNTVVITEDLHAKCVERVQSVAKQIDGSGLGGSTGAVSE